MLEEHPSALEPGGLPEVEIKRRRGISLVWLIPLVAGAIAIWLGYTTLQEKGPTITVAFDNAEGLDAPDWLLDAPDWLMSRCAGFLPRVAAAPAFGTLDRTAADRARA